MASTHDAKIRLQLLIDNYAKIIALGDLKCTRTLLISLFKQNNGTDILQLLLNTTLLKQSVYDEKPSFVSHKVDSDNYDHQLQIFLTECKFSPDIAEVLSNNYGKLRKLAFTNNNIIVLIKKIGLMGFNSLLVHGLPLLSKGFSPNDLIDMLPMTKKGIVRLFDFLNDEDNWAFLTAPNGMNLFHNELVMIGKNFSSTATLELLMIDWQTLTTLFSKAQIISIASHRCAKRRLNLLINNWDKLVYLNNLNYPFERLVIFLRQKNGVEVLHSLFESPPIFLEEVIGEEVVFNSADELQRQELLLFLENIDSVPKKGVNNGDEQVVSPHNEGLDFSSHSFFSAVSPPSLLHHVEPIIDDFGYGFN